MSNAETLLAMCEAAPDDDEPRLIWADNAGGERGELVAVQCALARGGLSAARSGALRKRQHELLAANGRAWSGLAPLARQCRFRRGFVELARFSAAEFLGHADQIFAAAPLLTSVVLDEITDAQLGALISHPRYGQLRGLGLPRLGDDAMTAAIAAGAFARLEALALDNVSVRVARRFEPLALTRLEINTYTDENVDAIPWLLAATPALRALDLSIGNTAFAYLDAIPPTVTALRVGAGALHTLERLPHAERIEQLALRPSDPHDLLPSFAPFTKLRSLDLHQTRYRALDEPLARGELAGLRELRAMHVIAETAEVICATVGHQLELLEIGHTADATTLAGRVAGLVIASPWMPWPAPMFAGELPDAPFWDYPLRELNGYAADFTGRRRVVSSSEPVTQFIIGSPA